jgi:hypothetical protein
MDFWNFLTSSIYRMRIPPSTAYKIQHFLVDLQELLAGFIPSMKT